MNRFILTLLLVWLALAAVGAAIQGRFWLTLVAMALILGTGAVGEATSLTPPSGMIRRRRPECGAEQRLLVFGLEP